MCKNLESLKQLTSQLSPVPDFKTFEKQAWEGWKEYHVLDGFMRSESLYHCDEVTIVKTHITKHSILQEHIHKDSMELLVILEGQLKLIVNNRVMTLNPFDHVKIDKNTNHIAMATEDTLLIAVTIPKDDGFPK